MEMPEAIAHPFAHCEGFYVIIGTSAAALTGLQFVLIALIAEGGVRTTVPGIAAFATPTILHFCAADATRTAPALEETVRSWRFDVAGRLERPHRRDARVVRRLMYIEIVAGP